LRTKQKAEPRGHQDFTKASLHQAFFSYPADVYRTVNLLTFFGLYYRNLRRRYRHDARFGEADRGSAESFYVLSVVGFGYFFAIHPGFKR
jgi:hypothetical protein